MIAIIGISCFFQCGSKFESAESQKAKVMIFYEANHTYDFTKFECLDIFPLNPFRPNLNEDYFVEWRPNCSESNLIIRGKLQFKKDKIIFESSELQQIDTTLFWSFKKLGISSLRCEKRGIVAIAIYPGIQILKKCSKTNDGFVNIDSCWSYRVASESD